MEVVLDIKNVPKVMNPTVDAVITYDGKKWYLTTKETLLTDAYKLIEKAKEELENIKKENKDFKTEVAHQMYEMSEIIKKLYEVEK